MNTAIPLLPDNAPFTPAQRSWLNGFFAAVLGVGRAAAHGAGGIAVLEAPPAVEEEFPWHDPTLAIEERMKLAEGRPLAMRLMAATAQLDCGACGYLCKTYTEAIAREEENDLTKCTPGGRETARKFKELLAEPRAEAAPTASVATAPPAGAITAELRPGIAESLGAYSRQHPFAAPLVASVPLNKHGSEKDTRAVVLDLAGSGLSYNAGDALGVYPENCPELVQWIMEALRARGDEEVTLPDGRTLCVREALLKEYVITESSEQLLSLMARSAKDPVERIALESLVERDRNGFLEGQDVLDLLTRFPSVKAPVAELVAALSPLPPRLYSIASSPKAHPDQVHLTVGVVRYSRWERLRKGVASTYLAERVQPGQRVRVFVQRSHGFGLPESGDTPIIMVGPGTGIAPFRAFLQERRATGARGRAWLFFGDQRQDCDFLYREELEEHLRHGTLSRLETAFSRDQEEKVYVQHRLLENAAEVWSWLVDGAHLYVCGDAKRMARDVDETLRRIATEQGRLSPDAAKRYLTALAREMRYQRDVY
jgi:sulfite reductase (NADPH) flavoprotein alpha-component